MPLRQCWVWTRQVSVGPPYGLMLHTSSEVAVVKNEQGHLGSGVDFPADDYLIEETYAVVRVLYLR
jgi:hypothetical protein